MSTVLPGPFERQSAIHGLSGGESLGKLLLLKDENLETYFIVIIYLSLFVSGVRLKRTAID